MQTMSPFSLGRLPYAKCWMLFKCCAFDNQEANVHINLLKIGHSVVQKCDGMPLAVKVLGGLLRYERDEDKWRQVLASDTLVVEKNEVMPVLMLSYYHMPLHMRPCFLYLSVFPKNTRFEKERVVRLWMAQGYIKSRPNKTPENIGDEYFEELRCRSLIDSSDYSSYVLHDLIRDLARSINERMYPTVKDDNAWDNSFSVYHLYLNRENRMPSHVKINNPRSVRTLLHYQYNGIPTIFTMISIRVLELHTESSELSCVIGNLKHLRYLEIHASKLERLPDSLCVLYNLQTLDLRKCNSLTELPRDIGNLTSLRLLEVPYHIMDMPPGFGKLTNLKTIKVTLNVRGDAMHGGLGELKNLNNLEGSMRIGGLDNITSNIYAKEANLKSKINQECLELSFDKYDYEKKFNPDLCLLINDAIGMEYCTKSKEIQQYVLDSLQPHCNIKKLAIRKYRGTEFPSWLGDPLMMPKLTYLDLWCCSTMNSFLPPLGQLPSLKFLSINGPNVQKIGNEFLRDGSSSVAFPSLEELVIGGMPGLKECIWVLDGCDFTCLTKLSFYNCPNLRKFPTFPNKLEQLRITNCGIHEIKFALPSNIQFVNICQCTDLTSVVGLNCHKTWTTLVLECCPLLEISMDDLVQLMGTNCSRVYISTLRNVYLYLRDDTLKMFDVTLNYEVLLRVSLNILVCSKEVLANPFPEQISFQQFVVLHLPVLEKMVMTSKFQMGGLKPLENLKRLCILGCPKLRQLTDWWVASPFLEILEVSCCDELIAIPPLHKSTALLEIRIRNCPALNKIVGLRCLTSLRTLFLKDCQKLRALPSEKLDFRIEAVEICDCPNMRDWCQLNNFVYSESEGVHHFTAGEASSSTEIDAEGDLDTTLLS
ncbi:hypothetical protein LUZ60_013667 [Juncus effusus]|nr:hypothetical protein LUZ60_013667 [Juncus effusus]